VLDKIVLDRTRLKKLFHGCDAYIVGHTARHVLHGAPAPVFWTVITTDKSPLLVEHSGVQLKGFQTWYEQLNLMVWQEDVGLYLRESSSGKDAIALHLATGAILHAEEYWISPHTPVSSRRTKLLPTEVLK